MRRLRLATLLVLLNVALVVLAAAGLAAAADRGWPVLAAMLAGLAALSALLAGRWVARPLRALAQAAGRIGQGDLTTPVPRAAGGAEVATLADTLEDTRLHLLELTAQGQHRQAESEAILAGMTEGVLSVDRDRRIRYLNVPAAALLGVRPEEALGRFCGDVLKPRGAGGVPPCEDDCPIVHARFRRSAQATEPLLLTSGERAVVVTASKPAGERQFVLLRDETDVEAARRLRDAILAYISHEFRTPLSAQRASLELLRSRLAEQGLDDGDLGELALALERGGLRLLQLVDNLLESVRIEAGQGTLRNRPLALDEVVEEAVELTAPLLRQRGQTIEVDLPHPLPRLTGDAPRLTQMLVNLIANAHKFSPAGSPIRIGGQVEPRSVWLWVEDEGPGLPGLDDDEPPALFRRFARAGRGGEEPGEGGMGLGLWIVQSIAERHGGTVEAAPGTAGVGTRVKIRLPLTGGAGGASGSEGAR